MADMSPEERFREFLRDLGAKGVRRVYVDSIGTTIDPDLAATLLGAGGDAHHCHEGCEAAALSRVLRLLLGAAEEGGMPTSRADAIVAEVMSRVLSLDRRGRSAEEECGKALDAVWDELDDDDDEDGDGTPEDTPDEPAFAGGGDDGAGA